MYYSVTVCSKLVVSVKSKTYVFQVVVLFNFLLVYLFVSSNASVFDCLCFLSSSQRTIT